jgi:hypothetical protein
VWQNNASQNCVRSYCIYYITLLTLPLYYIILFLPHARIMLNHGLDRMWKKAVEGKVHPVTCHEGTRSSRNISTLPLTSASKFVGGRHSPAALPPGKSRYPLYWRLSGPQGLCGRVRKISSPVIRSPDRPGRSELLYRLRYPGPERCAHHIVFGAIQASGRKTEEKRITVRSTGEREVDYQPFTDCP